MNSVQVIEDVDDPAPLEEDENVQSFQTIDHSTEGVFNVISIDSDTLLKCDGIITLQDGTQWCKVPIALAGIKEEGVERQVEVWENIEIGKDDNIIIAESFEKQADTSLKEEEPVAAEVVVLENGSIAYITPATDSLNSLDPGISEEEEPEKIIIKKKNKSFYCIEPGCQRSYSSLHHLKVHVRNHTGDRPFKCSIEGCDKAFASDYSRKAHLRTHTGEKPYPCTRCKKSFKTSGDLQKHVRTHTGERPFLCPVEGCNRKFTTSNIRKVHIRTHTGERPYTCSFENCNRSFASSTNYKNHMRIHSGEKPFCCPVANCKKRFTEYSSLYKHQLVHCPVKRYKCPFCCKMYRQMSTLTTHKRTIHGVISAEDGSEIILGQVIDEKREGLKIIQKILKI
ncbi:uncharacterized protein isoform X1 [Rhodnius prolixus]